MSILKRFLTVALFCLCTTALAHDGKNHDKMAKQDTTNHSKEEQGTQDITDSLQSGKVDTGHNDESVHSHGSNEFPTLHPLVVHFPIMFLITAAIFQIAQFFVFKYELSWLTLILLLLGFIGAYVAGKYVHPHTYGLSERAAHILKEHDMYADWTVWLSGIGVLLKIVSHFVLKRKVWAEAIVSIVLIGAAYSVALAGHHGAELVHIEGVGPQGKFLEKHHNH